MFSVASQGPPAARIAAASLAALASAAAAMRSAARAADAAAAAAAAGSGDLGRTMRSGMAKCFAAYSLVLPRPTQLSRLLRAGRGARVSGRRSEGPWTRDGGASART